MTAKIILTLLIGIGIGFAVHYVAARDSKATGHGHGAHESVEPLSGDERVQISRTASFELPYPPELATLLFSAEGEKLWLGDVGWNPAIHRGDGFNRADVFAVGATNFITIVFDPERGRVEYARVAEGKTAGLIEIDVVPSDAGSLVTVNYHMTSLGDAGDVVLSQTTDAAFAEEMEDWRTAIKTNESKIRDWFRSKV